MERDDKIREFIVEGLLYGEGDKLKNDTPFYELGIVDSMGMLELISYLEETFEMEIEMDEMIPENIGSLDNILSFLDKKLIGSN